MEQQAVKEQFFVAVITDEFLAKAEKYLLIIKSVQDGNDKATLENRTHDLKPMYVIVRRGVKWGAFGPDRFNWRQIHFYDTDKEFDTAFDKIKKDVVNWKKIHN